MRGLKLPWSRRVKPMSQQANNAVKVTTDRISPPQEACAIPLRNRPCCVTYYLPFREQMDRAGDCVTGTRFGFSLMSTSPSLSKEYLRFNLRVFEGHPAR